MFRGPLTLAIKVVSSGEARAVVQIVRSLEINNDMFGRRTQFVPETQNLLVYAQPGTPGREGVTLPNLSVAEGQNAAIDLKRATRGPGIISSEKGYICEKSVRH